VVYNFQPEKIKTKLLTEYENVTHKVVFINAVLAALMSGRQYNGIIQNGDCSRERQCAYFDFSKQRPLSKRNVVTELNMDKIES
jgi:hypothetical protein